MVRRRTGESMQGALPLGGPPGPPGGTPSPTPARTVPPAPMPPPPRGSARDAPLTVSELVRAAHRLVEETLGWVWIEGEIANLRVPGSGHAYFSLKDAGGQLPAVMWRSAMQRLRFRLDEGAKVLVRGRLGVYPEQGKLQLYAENIEPAGLGAAALALEQLKQRLAAEGLFAEARKRPLPRWPRRVGVVTSPTGAAVRDIIRVIERRSPVPILVSPTRVQGEGAAAEIAQALRALAHVADVDVVIIGRGGGSAEDLSAFNDEAVVRAIFEHPVPVVSAVGHEVDVTLADLVADLRAATPTAAGELCVPERAVLGEGLAQLETRLLRAWRHGVTTRRRELERAAARIPTPAMQLGRARQRVDELVARAQRVLTAQLGQRRRLLAALDGRRGAAHPRTRLREVAITLAGLEARLAKTARRRVELRRQVFAELAARLGALSPLGVLERGYALARTPDGRVVTDASTVAVGDALDVHLARGRVRAEVTGVVPGGARKDGGGES